MSVADALQHGRGTGQHVREGGPCAWSAGTCGDRAPHALRNALVPTITVLAQDFGFLIGGIVAIETIFAYPGLGRLLIFALQRQDLPLMQAAILVLTAVYCLANLAADLLYGVANPRIRYGGAVD